MCQKKLYEEHIKFRYILFNYVTESYPKVNQVDSNPANSKHRHYGNQHSYHFAFLALHSFLNTQGRKYDNYTGNDLHLTHSCDMTNSELIFLYQSNEALCQTRTHGFFPHCRCQRTLGTRFTACRFQKHSVFLEHGARGELLSGFNKCFTPKIS